MGTALVEVGGKALEGVVSGRGCVSSFIRLVSLTRLLHHESKQHTLEPDLIFFVAFEST